MLVLNNTSWIIRVARVITNYIHYIERHYNKLYAEIIYPAIYGKEYEDPIQLTVDDTDDLATEDDSNVIDDANIEASERSKFQKGNTQGVRYAPETDKNQLTMDNEDDIM